MKHLVFTAFVTLILGGLPLSAEDKAPSGYQPISEYKEAIAKSNGKKLIVLVVKGLDDKCPNCKDAMKNGERAVGSEVIKIFARAETLNKADLSTYPQALQDRAKKTFTTNAFVTFLVFDPKMEKIIAESSRTELQSNKKLIAEFKKVVQEAQGKLW
jgi:cytochrome c2